MPNTKVADKIALWNAEGAQVLERIYKHLEVIVFKTITPIPKNRLRNPYVVNLAKREPQEHAIEL